MLDPQIIRTTSGEELVVLPRADYDALVAGAAEAEEDAADAAAYRERMAALSAGVDEVLPEPVSSAILKGDRLMKAIRRWRGLTQVVLAEQTGLAQGYLSEIEAGTKRGSEEALERIAAALEVPVDWLRPKS